VIGNLIDSSVVDSVHPICLLLGLLLLGLLHSRRGNDSLDTRNVNSSERSTVSASCALEDDAFHALANRGKSLEKQWMGADILLGAFRNTSESPQIQVPLKGLEGLSAEEGGHDLLDKTLLVVDLEGLSAWQPRDGHVQEARRVRSFSQDPRKLLLVFIFAPLEQEVELPRESELLGDLRCGTTSAYTASSFD